jgi:hypothetical protein
LLRRSLQTRVKPQGFYDASPVLVAWVLMCAVLSGGIFSQ